MVDKLLWMEHVEQCDYKGCDQVSACMQTLLRTVAWVSFFALGVGDACL